MGVTSFAGRCRWHLHALGFNPLIRASDRLEALVVLAVLVTAFLAIPIAAHAGSEVRAAGVRSADLQAHDRHSVMATALDGSTGMPSDFDSLNLVRAQWRDGTELHTERIITPVTVKAGEPMKIWLDDRGTVVPAPLTVNDARLSAQGTMGTVWAAIVVCSAMLAFLIRRGLDRSRDRAWERELRLLTHNDDGWANRHT